ncbi:helix-turn-helix domain-containing protein [Burkholderia metallica]|uniref:helix-turn-helix domain-containing protein n=1 Tax=Burkholderia metallica TaxID=488729 RepID=UPI00157BA2CE|nr:helix-turn-helix domain-containing protein [Burkholderia metallica]NTZ84378.1 helix-turn-helix domain-containing protein [Burkholderia metallica]
MSTAVTMFQWRRAMEKSELPSVTKLVLHTLAGFTNEFGQTCWPALETLAERAGIAVRTASKHLRIARDKGWVDNWKSRQPGRQWAHSHYRLRAPDGCLAEEQVDGEADKLAERRASDVVAGASDDASAALDATSNTAEAAMQESYWHQVPTNNPENRKMEKSSLSHTSEVYPGSVSERGEDFQESDATELAAWMRDRVKAIDPEGDEPNLRSWACEIKRMRTDDGRDERAMVRLFAWALRDKFWKRVITSPHRLRKHWTEVRRRRNAALEQPASTPDVGAAAPAVDDRLCAHVDANGVRCTHVATILGIGVARRGYCRHHVGYYED